MVHVALLLAIFVGAFGCSLEPAEYETEFAAEQEAEEESLNQEILELTKTYPTDGKHPFFWAKGEGTSDGCTLEMKHKGTVVCTPNPMGTHCCGMTFEVYLRAAQPLDASPIGEFSAEQITELKNRFFGNSKDIEDKELRLVQLALTSMKLGKAIDKLDDARAGDFVQFWRVKEKPNGHQAIFLGWERDENQEIVAIRYWSSQKSTNGIGIHKETIGTVEGNVNRDKIFIGRALRHRIED